METVGFVGLGSMGRPMAKNLVAAGFSVRAWNRSPGKVPEGAYAASSARDAATGARIVVTMLSDNAAVLAVEADLLAGLGPGCVHIGMSTISTALSARLFERHAAAGQHFVAAPVFGRPDAAEKKLLWILPGGDPAAVASCAPVFAALGQGTFPMGGAAQASLAKLIGNFMIAAHIEMLGEGLALAEKGGLDPVKLHAALAGSAFGSPLFKLYGGRIASTEWEPAGFALPLGLKDVRLALAAAGELGTPMPLAVLARERLEQAVALGRERFDFAGFASVIREAAGLPAKRS